MSGAPDPDAIVWQDDGRATHARLGVIVPHLDLVPESELRAMAPAGVSIHGARVPLGMFGPDGRILTEIGADIVRAFAEAPGVDDAASMLAAASVDVVIYGFTSSSYAFGRAGEDALKTRLEARAKGIPVVIAAEAARAALHAVGAKRIALIHPPWFSAEADRLGREYFAAAGFAVAQHGPAQLAQGLSDASPRAIYDYTLATVPADADAVFFGGNGFRVSGAIQALEQALDRPVLGANQVVLWQALRAASLALPITAYGRLFAVA